MKLIIDAYGGDNAPGEIVKGTVDSLNSSDGFSVIFTGKKDGIQAELDKYEYPKDRVEIADAPDVILMEDHPVEAVRKKKESSMVVGLNLLKEKKGDAFISCGSTGACLAGATFIVGRIKGVLRPALAPVLPNKNNGVLLIDCGANMDCKPAALAQFAVMGSAYMEKVMGVENPRVGLANVGTEDTKGNEVTKETFALIRGQNAVNFTGNAEGRDLIDRVDVMVADGFTGNLMLKSMEGFGSYVMEIMKSSFTETLRCKIGAALLMPALKKLKKSLDYNAYGGAPFLGVEGIVIKGHGSNKAKGVSATISQAVKMVQADIVSVIKENIAEKSVNE